MKKLLYKPGDQLSNHEKNTKITSINKLRKNYNSQEFRDRELNAEKAYIKYSSKVLKMRAFWEAQDLLSNMNQAAIAQKEIKFCRMQFQILIVEDNKNLRDLYRDFLAHYGFTNIDVAANGEIALELCELRDYDLIFSDYGMPEMDGLALYRALQAKCNLASFVLVSGYSPSQFNNLRKSGVLVLPKTQADKTLANMCVLATGYYIKKLNLELKEVA